MTLDFATEAHDYSRIEKLNSLKNPETFYKEVLKFTKNIHSDHSIRQWEWLCEIRSAELEMNREFKDTYLYSYYTGLLFKAWENGCKTSDFNRQFAAQWEKHEETAREEKRTIALERLKKYLTA